jgi:hypothetical protein
VTPSLRELREAGNDALADAGVDQDALASGLDDEPVDRERGAAVRIQEVRLEPAAVAGERVGRRIGKQPGERDRNLALDDPGDA